MIRSLAWVATVALLSLATPRARAHQELYHNVDVDLVQAGEPGEISIYFTIHAPELLVGFGEAADAMFDKRWLSERSDEELRRIIGLARTYLEERFEIGFEGRGEPVDLAKVVTFDSFDRIRSAVARQELPPACLQGAVRLAIPPLTGILKFGHAANSDKRLMLVVLRPEKFPEVIDVDAGEEARVALPTAERHKISRDGDRTYLMIVIVAVVLLGFLQIWRGRRLAARKLGHGR